METVSDFIFGGSKITADGDCSREIERRLLLGRKVMTNLCSILKSGNVTLPTKVHLVKVVVYGCESWTTKKAECRRIDAFELWCCRRLFFFFFFWHENVFFFFLFYFIFNLYITVLDLPNIKMNPPQVYIFLSLHSPCLENTSEQTYLKVSNDSNYYYSIKVERNLGIYLCIFCIEM